MGLFLALSTRSFFFLVPVCVAVSLVIQCYIMHKCYLKWRRRVTDERHGSPDSPFDCKQLVVKGVFVVRFKATSAQFCQDSLGCYHHSSDLGHFTVMLNNKTRVADTKCQIKSKAVLTFHSSSLNMQVGTRVTQISCCLEHTHTHT